MATPLKAAEATPTADGDAFQLELKAAAIAEGLQNHKDKELCEALKIALENRPAVVQAFADWAIPDRAYASARLLLENRICGRVKSFSEADGYGFIESPAVKEAFGSDVFLHYSQLNSFFQGSEVSFAILLSKDGKPQAFDLGPAQDGQDTRKAQGTAKGGGWDPKGNSKGGKAGAGKSACKGWGGAGWGADASWAGGCGGAMGGWWGGPIAAAKGAWWGGDWDSSGGWGGGWGGGVIPAAGKGAKGGGKGSQGGKPAVDVDAANEAHKGERYEGTLKSFNENQGFGFIQCDLLKELYGYDTFIHHKQYPQGCELYQAVSFTVSLSKEGKPQAYEVKMEGTAGAPPAKRARNDW